MFCLAVFLLRALPVYANDTAIVRSLLFRNMVFHSELEEQMMKRLTEGQKPSMFEMMLATDKYTFMKEYEELNASMDSFINELGAATVKMKLDDRIRYVFKAVHKEYLKKYEERILVSDLFKNGHYNCVTGTSLYTHCLNKLGIPYQVKETPNHVYLICDPEGNNIPIESTDPRYGYIKPGESLKSKYIKYLIDSKTIEESELDSLGREKVFLKYYYSQTNINDQKLAALQYYNTGLFNLEHNDLVPAIQAFEKSYYMYPSKNTKFLLLYSYEVRMALYSYGDTANINSYINSYYLSPPEKRTTVFYEKFKELKDELLVAHNSEKLFEQYYNSIRKELNTDSILMAKIRFLHHYEIGRHALVNNDYKKALPLLCSAGFIEPRNIDIRQAIEFSITKQVAVLHDPRLIIIKLDEICNSYEQIKRYNIVQHIYAINYLKMADDFLAKNDRINGADFISAFEELGYSDVHEDLIGNVYAKAYDTFGKAKDFKTARLYLDKGLRLAPRNKLLLERRRT